MEKVCILLSTYNGESFLEEQLQSLKKQIGVETCLMIRDDGSSDNTIQIINRWQSNNPGWITLEKGKNLGFFKSFSKLLCLALKQHPDAQYFAFCDQDDVWLEKKLSTTINQLKSLNSERPLLYFSNLTVVDNNLQETCSFWKDGEVEISKHRALVQNFAPGCTEVFNRLAAEVYAQHYPQKAKFHDYLIYLICVFMGSVIYDENSYILYRQHQNNTVGYVNRMQVYVRFFKRLFHRKENKYGSYEFAVDFLDSFKSYLSVEDILIINELINYKSSFWAKLALIFNNKIKSSKIESNILFKVKVLMGWL